MDSDDRLYLVRHIHEDGRTDDWGVFDSIEAARAALAAVSATLSEWERKHVSITAYPRNPADLDDALGDYAE